MLLGPYLYNLINHFPTWLQFKFLKRGSFHMLLRRTWGTGRSWTKSTVKHLLEISKARRVWNSLLLQEPFLLDLIKALTHLDQDLLASSKAREIQAKDQRMAFQRANSRFLLWNIVDRGLCTLTMSSQTFWWTLRNNSSHCLLEQFKPNKQLLWFLQELPCQVCIWRQVILIDQD